MPLQTRRNWRTNESFCMSELGKCDQVRSVDTCLEAFIESIYSSSVFFYIRALKAFANASTTKFRCFWHCLNRSYVIWEWCSRTKISILRASRDSSGLILPFCVHMAPFWSLSCTYKSMNFLLIVLQLCSGILGQTEALRAKLYLCSQWQSTLICVNIHEKAPKKCLNRPSDRRIPSRKPWDDL